MSPKLNFVNKLVLNLTLTCNQSDFVWHHANITPAFVKDVFYKNCKRTSVDEIDFNLLTPSSKEAGYATSSNRFISIILYIGKVR